MKVFKILEILIIVVMLTVLHMFNGKQITAYDMFNYIEYIIVVLIIVKGLQLLDKKGREKHGKRT